MTALGVAKNKRDAAVRLLAQDRKIVATAELQMQQLQSYANETDTRWTNQAQQSSTPEIMKHHYQFMARLTHAIDLQNGMLDTHRRAAEAQRLEVIEAEGRVSSLQQVCDQIRREEEQKLARREQKIADEMAANQYRKTLQSQHARGH